MGRVHVFDNIHTRFEGVEPPKDFDDGAEGRGAYPAMFIFIRVIYIVSGAVLTLVALRFILLLLAANQANVFSNFVFTVSRPFVEPFFGLFNEHPVYGVANIEIESLMAFVVYLGATWLIVRLLALMP